MRIKFIIAAFTLASLVALAGEPLVVRISNAGVEIEGVTYKSKVALVAAFRKLNPSSVQFTPSKDASYQAVSEALKAFQESGVKAQSGFVGAASEAK